MTKNQFGMKIFQRLTKIGKKHTHFVFYITFSTEEY